MSKAKNKKQMHLSKTSAIIVAGLLLVIFIGIVVASVLSQGEDSGSFFAAGKAIQVKYNDNLFVADTYNETVSGYNERLQIVAFNGKLEEKSFSLGQLFDVDLKEGQKYKLIVNYVGGSYESSQGNEPKIVFELQKNSKNYDLALKLAKYNGIEDPNLIKQGQIIELPMYETLQEENAIKR